MSLQLPSRPSLEFLKSQASELLDNWRQGDQLERANPYFSDLAAPKLSQAHLVIAREYGFESWAKLKHHVERQYEAGKLKDAIDRDDLDEVKRLMLGNPELHRAAIGYGENGPLTWAAECRNLDQPTANRLDMVRWMVENGSDIHQGGDGPLMRAALRGSRIPMMKLLVQLGADVNARWASFYPIVFAPCETLEPESLKWLLANGADPNSRNDDGTALDSVIQGYVRSPDLAICIDILVAAGGKTKYEKPAVLDILRNRVDLLDEKLSADPTLLTAKFAHLNFGASGGRLLTLEGGTLLHVAAEFGNLEAAELLLTRGADVNAKSDRFGQTPIFHPATQFGDRGISMVKLLLHHGADLSVRANIPGHYERPDEIVNCNPREYAELFPGGESETSKLLKDAG